MQTRALILTPIYPWPGDPYEAVFIHQQIMNLAGQGVKCQILTFRPGPPGAPDWLARWSWLRNPWRWLSRPRESAGVSIAHTFYAQGRRRRDDVIPSVAEALIRFIKRHPEYRECNVIYAHWLWTGGAAALMLRDYFGWPVVAMARGSEMHYWQAIHRHCLPYVKRVIIEADVAAANCEGLRRQAEKLVPGCADRIEVIYNGCNAQTFRPAEDKLAVRRKLGLDTRSRLLLFCGSIIERKGIEELAQAWEGFAAAHREWQLVVIGRIVDRSLARRLKGAGRGSVTMVGPVPHERVRMYMQAADAYIQPSRLEGLSNATMEAMATELPVIATDTNGQAELISNGVNGWLVPPGDAESLRAALEAAVEDPQRAQQFGMAARRTIETRFDPIREAKRLAAILQYQADRKVGDGIKFKGITDVERSGEVSQQSIG